MHSVLKCVFTSITISVAVNCTSNQTTLTGTINKDISYVLLSDPKIAVCHEAFLDTVFLDKNHHFKVKLNLQEDRFLMLHLPNNTSPHILPIQAGGNYQIMYDVENGFVTKGLNEVGIHQYQLVSDMKTIGDEPNTPEALSREEGIELLKQKELTGFSELLQEGKISPSFYALVEDDRTCYYAAKTAWLYSQEIRRYLRTNETIIDSSQLEVLKEKLGHTYEQYPPNDVRFMKSPHWRTYAYMLYIKIYPLIVFNRLNHQSVEQLLSSLHMPLWVEQTISSLTGESLEAVLALLIEESASLGYQKATVDAIIAAYQCFLESFPQSPYLLYFQEGIELNIAAYQATNFGPDFHFVEDSSIQTFQDLLAQYRGKKIFIDIWTITCGPCRKEFAYKEKLEPILQRNNAIALYIMLGVSDELKTKYKQTWESVIRKYDLKGYHYWANQPFIDDLQQLCDGESGSPSTIYVPWYMLIDEQGNILDKHFKRPSELVKDPSVAF